MAVCDYASLVTIIQPIQNATFLGGKLAIMGGSNYFSDLFRPQFSEHVAQFQHSGATSGKVGPPFKIFFGLSTACDLHVSSRNGWINGIEIGPKVYVR
jgi:hypothetical protein